MALLGCLAMPFQAFVDIYFYAPTIPITAAQSVLSAGILLLGCLAVPCNRRVVVCRYAVAFVITVTQIALCGRNPCCCGFAP